MKPKLIDYNKLGYEFAIRNPRVIELLSRPFTDDVAKELMEYGLNTMVEGHHEDGEYTYYGLDNLYLEYEHLKHLKLQGYVPLQHDEKYNWENYFKTLNYPHKSFMKESIEDAIPRITALIETRGGKLNRLMNGVAFENYDAVIFFRRTIYDLDTSTNKKKTIKSDIEFIKKWVEPNMYLQLLLGDETYGGK